MARGRSPGRAADVFDPAVNLQPNGELVEPRQGGGRVWLSCDRLRTKAEAPADEPPLQRARCDWPAAGGGETEARMTPLASAGVGSPRSSASTSVPGGASMPLPGTARLRSASEKPMRTS